MNYNKALTNHRHLGKYLYLVRGNTYKSYYTLLIYGNQTINTKPN